MSVAPIRHTSTEPEVRVELVTPAKAREYLARNTHNRPIRQHTVAAYARDMESGDWEWNGEGVKFAADGTLLDGQHRLVAITEAGVPVRMLVIGGLPNAAQETMDGGAKRRFADVLALRGEANYSTLAAVTRAVTSWEGGLTANGGSTTVTNAELFRTLEKYPWLRDGCTVLNRANAGAGLPSSIGGVLWWLFMQIDSEDCQYFFERLSSDQDHHKGEPVYAFRKFLADAQESIRQNRSRKVITAVGIKAWNKFRDGDQCDLLRFRVGGASPERFPQPH